MDDLGENICVKVFHGRLASVSGQVNWLGLRSDKGDYQLTLMNHAEATDVTIDSPFKSAPVSARLFDAKGKPQKMGTPICSEGKVMISLPSGGMAVILW